MTLRNRIDRQQSLTNQGSHNLEDLLVVQELLELFAADLILLKVKLKELGSQGCAGRLVIGVML